MTGWVQGTQDCFTLPKKGVFVKLEATITKISSPQIYRFKSGSCVGAFHVTVWWFTERAPLLYESLENPGLFHLVTLL